MSEKPALRSAKAALLFGTANEDSKMRMVTFSGILQEVYVNE